jgi:hypothetical protein
MPVEWWNWTKEAGVSRKRGGFLFLHGRRRTFDGAFYNLIV